MTVAFTPEVVLLASPRGFCAGVERAVDAVLRALELKGPPIYVRKQIVHNIHVVRDLEARGVVFVDDEQEVPPGETVVLSAHGVAPEVHRRAAERGLEVIDATCPLVTKVHRQAVKLAASGHTIVLVGHRGHEEVIGTMGEAPGSIVLVGTVDDVDRLALDDVERIAYITQTTLSVDETALVIDRLRQRFPQITGPARNDICYATSNRQRAVKQLARESDLVLVIGSSNSSNSMRLAEVAAGEGVPAYRIDDETSIREQWLEGIRVVGVTSGASAPEWLVDRVCDYFRSRGTTDIRHQPAHDEGVHFKPPKQLIATLP